LVDLSKSGKLNLEQFTMIVELVNECNHGVRLPEVLPPHLVPPSLRLQQNSQPPNEGSGEVGGALKRETSQPLNGVSNAFVQSQLPHNPRVQKLNSEIDSLLESRRKDEQDLFQIEADTTVKNSEIKNLEIELLTLTATVKQLQHQKGEANKRLQELDDRIAKFESNCVEQTDRLTSEQERLAKVKQEIAQSDENFSAEEEVLKTLRSETSAVETKQGQISRQLADGNGRMERLVDELTKMERRTDSDDKEVTKIEMMTRELAAALERMGEEKAMDDEEVPRLNFHRASLNDAVTSPLSPSQGKMHGFASLHDSSDPFKEADPFAGADDAFGADPFTSSNATSDDPFAPNKSNGFGGKSAKSNGTNEFADFAKFANFS